MLVDAYLRNLPKGLASFPECKAKATLVRTFADHHIAPSSSEKLPDELVSLLVTPPLPASWVSEVQFMCVTLWARESRFSSDEAFLSWVRRLNAELFATPLYRMIMWVASPRLLLAGAARRWQQFHRGTRLTVPVQGPGFAEMVIGFPPGLFNELHIRIFGVAFEAGIEAAGGKHCATAAYHLGNGEARVRVEWQGKK
jgi:hypothetical protein